MVKADHRKPLIICITDVEYKALKSYFSVSENETIASVVVEHGYFGNKPFSICRFTEMGSRGRDTVSQRLSPILIQLMPTFVIELGICFGLKNDFPIGSVGICQHSADYEQQKVNQDEQLYRTRTIQSDAELFAKLLNFSAMKKFNFEVFSAIYGCGDKVVNSNAFKKQILEAVPDAKCGDMESYSVGVVCTNNQTPWIVVKASSDDGVNKGDEFQEAAANNSVEFFRRFILETEELEDYFKVPYDVNCSNQIHFEHISNEVFNSPTIDIVPVSNSRDQYFIHKHPVMREAWVILYISKAHSIPETIRNTFAKLEKKPSRMDVCIASTERISESQRKRYEVILTSQGSEGFVAEIGKFIYKMILHQHAATNLISPPDNYVDQMIYRGDGSELQGSRYTRSFITSDEGEVLKPISVILGQGGIGKTTFCLRFAGHINAGQLCEKRMLLITKDDVLKSFSGETIDSISRLYAEYVRNVTGQIRAISQETFSLALSCGSIILMIDGIDEIESALGDKFNMPSFLDSINTLNASLNSCRVLMTTRDFNSQRFHEMQNVEVVFLKGFSDKNIDKYVENDSHEIQNRIKQFSLKIKNRDGLVNPYLLHVVRQFLLSDNKETWEDQVIQTERLKVDEPFDYCLARALLREIEKQSIGIRLDDYYDLLVEVVVEHENRMKVKDFDEYINVMLESSGNSSVSRSLPYLKFFLFNKSEGYISISHPEYVSHILLNKLCEIFNKEKLINSEIRIIRSIFGKYRNDTLGLRKQLGSRLRDLGISEKNVLDKIKYVFSGLKKEATGLVTENANFELHLLAIEYANRSTAVDKRWVLEQIHEKNNIDGMVILDNIPSVDFSDCTIRDSIFRNFTGFFNCKINENTKFVGCSFQNCSKNFNRENILQEAFDSSCNLDEGMRHLMNIAGDRINDLFVRAKSDVKQILKSMRQGLGFIPLSINQIKTHTNLVTEMSYEDFIRIMRECGTLNLSDSLYSVKKVAEPDAIALCDEDHSQGLVSKLIKEIGKNKKI